MKHIAKTYSKRLLWLGIFVWWLISFYIVVAQQSTTEFRFNQQLTGQFWSGIFINRTDIDFKFGGNKKVWLFFPRSLQTLSSGETIVLNTGNNNTCTTQIRGLYYNNERGERLRPLDQNTLTGLQAIDSSYNDMQLSWWLFTNCIGTNTSSGNVYGQVTILYHNTVYYLMGGTDYNFVTNLHGTNFSGTLKRVNNNLTWYLWDSYWGIWQILWTVSASTGNIVSPSTLDGLRPFTWTIEFLWYATTWITFDTTWTLKIISHDISENTLIINMSGLVISTASWTWDGKLSPPTLVADWDNNKAEFGKTGLPGQTGGSITRNILKTFQAGATTDSLIAHGGYFNVSFVLDWSTSGTVLNLYRSENWSVWTPNTPDPTCTLNSDLLCSFRTDHLSYFTTIQESTTTPTVTNTNWWGSATLTKDNCLYDATSKHNLSGANNNNIDYSPSYYDNDCEWPTSIIKTTPITACTSYSTEINGAYAFARNFNITTIDSCTQANLYGNLIRKDLAKMMVNFAENVFGRSGTLINNPKCASFSDITNETQDTKHYIQKICEYGLMWLESDGTTPQTKFNPYGKINRGQFGTILSRFIWMLDYSVGNNSKIPYYTKHLQALQKVGIMKKISTPNMQELRWWVLLTMKRIYDKVQ